LHLIHNGKCLSNGLIYNSDIEITEENIKTIYENEFSPTNFKLSCFCNSINEALIKTHEDLKELNINYKLSGSTLCSIFVYGNTILCANLGDSRAIVGVEENNKWTAVALSDDHKPSKKEEKKRILSCHGRIEPYKGKYMIIKIYLMKRSVLKECGLKTKILLV
jgi:serine/threonine protein phosphatase PrpC